MKANGVRLLLACLIPLLLWQLGGGGGAAPDLGGASQRGRPAAPASADGATWTAEAEGVMPEPPQQPVEFPPPGRSRRGWSRLSAYEKNHPSVKAAFGAAGSGAAAATVRILCDGEAAALGAVVDADGYVVSKASLLAGELACRLADGREVAAEIVGVDEEHDLALVKVACGDLTPVRWRVGNAPPPGSFVAAVDPEGSLLAFGVVSAEPRPIAGSPRPQRRRGWLGIALGGGESGLTITGVYRDTAASRAGLKTGDRVQSIDGAAMKSADAVVRTVGGRFAGDKIVLRVLRQDQELELAATLGEPDGHLPQDHWGGGPFSQRREGFPLALAHDAALQPADCGGPLVDSDGNVVGINIARALRVTTYAIPAGVVQKVVADLR